MGCEYDGLVLSGGAARGGAFLGALHKLREQDLLAGLKVVSGTSIGALAAVLVAKRASMTSALHTIADKPFQLDFDLLSLDPPFGVDSGAQLLAFIRNLIGTQTFAELRAATGIQVIVCATNLLRQEPTYFSSETHPGMEVAWAVRLSCSLPLLFAYGLDLEQAYVDGGLTDNFPIRPLVAAGCSRILGVRFLQPDPRELPKDVAAYVLTLMSCVAWQSARENDGACARLIELNVPSLHLFDLSMPRKTLRMLFNLGYSSV